jgi:integrase
MDFYNFKFADDEKNFDLVRDMFCFMAFTSLRYSDLENLKKANVFDDHIEVCTKKTHDKLSIPLTIHAKEIINKYKDEDYKNGKMFRVYANQKINELLKEAAKKVGLDREVVLIHYQGNTRIEEVKKFYEIIGCHDARRTFVCCSLAFGIPPTVVMSCTGHSTYNAMKPYIEVANETQRLELAKWDKADNQSDIRSDIAKKLEGVDEAMLVKVLELLNPA